MSRNKVLSIPTTVLKMASLTRHPRSENYSVKFRFGGKQFCKSLGTASEREANRLRAGIEGTLADLERGRLILPEEADVWAFVRSDGKLASKAAVPAKPATLSALVEAYFESQFGQKEANTLETEQLHRRHIERLIGGDKPVKAFTATDVQGYITTRSKEGVAPQTVKKEVATLRMMLYRASRLIGVKPADVREMFRGLAFQKTKEKPGFMTWDEIDAQIRRTNPDKKTLKSLWDRLFLDVSQVTEFLDWAEQRPNRQPVPYLPALLTAAAHTGARLSELCRSRIEDWDLGGGVVVLREKKKSQKGDTLRRVHLSPRLTATMRAWLGDGHPGGQLVFCREPNRELRAKRLYITFKNFTHKTKWTVLRGYHVFRHSFASNLARAGLDERVVDELMGHQTQDMKKRYRHFFPEQRRDAIAKLFG